MVLTEGASACWDARNSLYLSLGYTGVHSCKNLLTSENCGPIIPHHEKRNKKEGREAERKEEREERRQRGREGEKKRGKKGGQA